MADLADVMTNMCRRQRWEVEPHIPYDTVMDFGPFIKMERSHQAVLFTVRHHGTLAGNMAFILSPDMSEGGKVTASDHGFYLEPEHRKGFLAKHMLAYAEDTLRRLHVVGVYLGDKSPQGAPNLEPLFLRAGYSLYSRTFLKRL